MNWNDILARVDGVLTVGDLANVPACETCGEHAALTRAGLRLCPACHCTGLAWHWRVTPPAGMLVAEGSGAWLIVNETQHPLNILDGTTPLLPPPLPGCTALELLALLPGFEMRVPGLFQIPVGSGFYAFGGEHNGKCSLQLHLDNQWDTGAGLDPDAVILAATRFKALVAWLAQAALRGEAK